MRLELELLFVISLALCQIPCCVVATPVPEVPPAVMIVPYYLILSVVIPATILVIAKYSYHAYRRGNNLHAYPMELARCNLSQKSQPSSIITSSTRRAPKSTSKFMKYFTHPVCVGFLGSPNWETGCSQDIRPPRRKRLSKKRSFPRFSPKLETNNSQEPRFRSAPLHPVFLPKSPVSIMEVFSPALDISDCSAVHPHSPPCNDTTVSLRTPVSHHGSSSKTQFFIITFPSLNFLYRVHPAFF